MRSSTQTGLQATTFAVICQDQHRSELLPCANSKEAERIAKELSCHYPTVYTTEQF